MQWLARYKRSISVRGTPGRAGPVHLKNRFYVYNKGFFAWMKIFEKSILKILKRGCRTQHDLSISSLSLAEAPSAPPLRFARNKFCLNNVTSKWLKQFGCYLWIFDGKYEKISVASSLSQIAKKLRKNLRFIASYR